MELATSILLFFAGGRREPLVSSKHRSMLGYVCFLKYFAGKRYVMRNLTNEKIFPTVGRVEEIKLVIGNAMNKLFICIQSLFQYPQHMPEFQQIILN